MKPFGINILALFALIWIAAAGPALSARVLELPVNTRTLAAGYVYCLTVDEAGATALLAERIERAGGNPDDAAGWIASGYCRQFLARADRAVPQLRARVAQILTQARFDPNEPFSPQVKKGKGGDQAAGGVFRRIAKALGRVAGGARGGGGRGTCMKYRAVTGGVENRYCDRSWSGGA